LFHNLSGSHGILLDIELGSNKVEEEEDQERNGENGIDQEEVLHWMPG